KKSRRIYQLITIRNNFAVACLLTLLISLTPNLSTYPSTILTSPTGLYSDYRHKSSAFWGQHSGSFSAPL
ncbi:MAG: hypothetical protein ACYT04_92540, partial [Nostoc sp.]